jgi:hypothetical protein
MKGYERMSLTLQVPVIDYFDETANHFVTYPARSIVLEHSLISLSKWEMKWNISFLRAVEDKTLTNEQLADYIRFMTIGREYEIDWYMNLPIQIVSDILDYINQPMTATKFKPRSTNPFSKPYVTNEEIYYWMCAYQIPFDPCEKWHLNRLMTLVRVCEEKNNPKKMNKKDQMAEWSKLNAMRKAKYHTKG